MINYIISPLALTDKDAFFEASREELRALLALIECGGVADGIDEISQRAKISKARANAALVFWSEAGVIRENTDAPTITEEFEMRLRKGEITELPAVTVAKTIRDKAIADMIAECAMIMNRAAFNTTEIKELTALHEQYALSCEFIIMLASYLAESGKATVKKLVNKAISLTEKDIDTPTALEDYISSVQSRSVAESAFRKILGLYDRALSSSEKESFRRWSEDYGYYTEIVGEAYDIAVTSGAKRIISYMNKLLCGWYEAGCRTVLECRQKYELDQKEKEDARKEARKSAKKPQEERFGAFDVNDAFMKALDRSYGTDDKK